MQALAVLLLIFIWGEFALLTRDSHRSAHQSAEHQKAHQDALRALAAEADEEDDITDEEQGEGGSGNGNSNAPQQPGDPGNSSGDGDGEGEGAGAGADSASNQVIDGSTYYGDEYSGSLSDAQNSMNSDSNLSGDDKGVIGDYFHNIQK